MSLQEPLLSPDNSENFPKAKLKQKVHSISTSGDFEVCLNGRIHTVEYFAGFDFSSGPEDLCEKSYSGQESLTVTHLTGDQKVPFEKWLEIQRWGIPPKRILGPHGTKGTLDLLW